MGNDPMRRCKSIKNVHGVIHYCEGVEGHASWHFSGEHIWPNENKKVWLEYAFWITLSLVVVMIVYCVVRLRHG